VIAYRRAREAALVPYPHVYMTLHGTAEDGHPACRRVRCAGAGSVAALIILKFHHIFDYVVTFEGYRREEAA